MRRISLFLAASAVALAASPALAETDGGPASVSEVVVTGAPYAVSLDSVTTSVNVLNRAALQTLPPAGLGDTLSGLPGLRSTAYGPGASRPVIRGLSGPRVMLLENGQGLVDASALSPDHAVPSDPGLASRIEVLRGPSTLAYGGSGIGGVVNVIDERVPTSPARNGLEGRITASGSTVDDGRSVSAGVKVGSGPLVFTADIVSRRSDDYKISGPAVSDRLAARDGLTVDPEKRVLNTDVKMDSWGVGVGFVADNGAYAGMSFKDTKTVYGVPYPQVLAPIDPNAEGPVAIDLHQWRIDLLGEVPFEAGPFAKVKVATGYADYEHAEIERESGEVGTRFLSKGVEGRIELVQREMGPLKGAVGAQWLHRNFEAIGDEAYVPKTKIDEIGVFTLQRLDYGKWGLDGGLRLDRRTLDSQLAGRPSSAPATAAGINWSALDGNREFTNVSASVGLFWRPVEGSFYAVTLAHNGRAPTEGELFADGPHPGTNAFELGDPSLDSEKVTSVELTGRWNYGRFRSEAHLWHARYDGYIEEAPTGDIEDGLPVFRYSQTDARFTGAEVEGTYDVWTSGARTLSTTLSADWVRGETDNGVPARIPPVGITGKLEWKGPVLQGRLEVRHVTKQDRVAEYELPTDGYTLVNLYGSIKPFEASELRLFAEGRNLTDEEAREHVSFLKDIAPQPGRSFRVGVTWSF